MEKFDLGVMILTGLSIVSLVVLAALSLDTSVLTPIVTTLLGYLVGRKRDVVMGYFGK